MPWDFVNYPHSDLQLGNTFLHGTWSESSSGRYWRDDHKRVHIFTRTEAADCLRGRRVLFSGDSYHEQTFIGLADVLLGDNSNHNIRHATERGAAVRLKQEALAKAGFGGIRFVCTFGDPAATNEYLRPCYKGSASTCAACLRWHQAGRSIASMTPARSSISLNLVPGVRYARRAS